MNTMLKKYLEDLERRIDPDTEDLLLSQWQEFSDGNFSDGIFSPRRQNIAPSFLEWPEVNINDAIASYEMMALHQLRECSRMLDEGSGELLCARCNYGTGILPSLFGVELFIMDRETNTLPTTKPLKRGREAIKVLLDRGIPNLSQGLGAKVFDMGQRFVYMMADYPKINQYVTLYHPDLQGPIDVCELLWGSALFLDLLDVPDLVHDLLKLITETYIRFMREWLKIVPSRSEYAVHWALLHQGVIMLRDDSAMNLSPQMFQEFIEPYDQRLLHEFGGGAIHFCGRGDHYIHRLAEMDGVFAVNLSQPECNDMETIFAHTADRRIKILGLPRYAAEQALQQGRDLHGSVHCW